MTSVFDQSFPNNSGCCVEQNPDTSSRFGTWKQQVGDRVLSLEDKKQKDEVDAMLSEAISNLTFEEREKQQEALHGVDDGLSEEAHATEQALVELDSTLVRIKHGTLYETAERMNSNYVQARDFRIMFLRAKRYNVQEAAEQILKFFEVKQNLFGTEKLTKDITIKDLDEDDIACLRRGSLQFSGKDRPGRTVINQIPGLRAFRILRNELRVRYFMFMDLLKDEDVQLRGVISLNFFVDNLRDSKRGAGFMEHMLLTNAIPLHTVAAHFCCDDVSQYIILKLVIAAMPQALKSRFKVHIGSALECQYHLATYGISCENLPIVPGESKVDMTRHLDWCRLHSALPNSGQMSWSLVKDPTLNDVLYISRRRSYNDGNSLLRNAVAEWSHVYDSGTKETKRRVVDGIIDIIHQTGGRFLQQSDTIDSCWLVVPREEVRLKLSQAFRNQRRKREGRCRGKRN